MLHHFANFPFTEVLDYRGLSNNVTFFSSSDDFFTQCLPLMIVDDAVLEHNESLNLILSLFGPLNNVIFDKQNAVVHIIDNDGESCNTYIYTCTYKCASSYFRLTRVNEL